MAELILREHLDTDPIDCVKELVQSSMDARIPVSRFGLTEAVSERTGLSIEESRAHVEKYCDIFARHVPAYLRTEFNLFWPKALAFAFGIAGLGVFWRGVTLFRAKQSAWLWFAVGTIVFGIGVFQWVRSLERYHLRSQTRRRAKNERLKAKYAKPR